MGSGTRFSSELRPGDTIILTHPTTLQEERATVHHVYSNMSIAIREPFSSDLISSTAFEVEQTGDRSASAASRSSQAAIKGDEPKPTSAAIRVKVGSSYITVEQSLHGQDLDRSDILKMREKKTNDRFCK
jgi:hypothetical protein